MSRAARPRWLTTAVAAASAGVLIGSGWTPALADDEPPPAAEEPVGGQEGEPTVTTLTVTVGEAPQPPNVDIPAVDAAADEPAGIAPAVGRDQGGSGEVQHVVAEPGGAVDVHQHADGEVEGPSTLHIEQHALFFSLSIEEGPLDGDGAAGGTSAVGDGTEVQIVQVASGAARGGASVEIRQRAVAATVGRAHSTSSSAEVRATGATGTRTLVQSAEVGATGQVTAAVDQLVGVLDAGAAFAGPLGSLPPAPANASGTSGDVLVGQDAVLLTSTSVVVEQGATVVLQGTAAATTGGGTATWAEPSEVSAGDAADLVAGVVAVANAVLEEQGLHLEFDPDEWTITVEVLDERFLSSPAPGFTVDQRVTSVAVRFRRTGVDDDPTDDTPWVDAPALDPVEELVPLLTVEIDLEPTDGQGGATAVGVRADVDVCQQVGASTGCGTRRVEVPHPAGPGLDLGGLSGWDLGSSHSHHSGQGTDASADDTDGTNDGTVDGADDSKAGAGGPAGGADTASESGRVVADVRTVVVRSAEGEPVAGVIEVRPASTSRVQGAAAQANAQRAPAGLARTGAEALVLWRAGVALVAGGTALVAGSRLRRRP